MFRQTRITVWSRFQPWIVKAWRYLSLFAVLVTLADDSYSQTVGDYVFPTRNAVFQVVDVKVADYDISWPLEVESVNGNWFYVGSTYIQRDQTVSLEKAVAYYTDLILKNARDDWSYRNRGYYFIATKNYEKAVSDFTKALEINPNSSTAYRGRSEAYLRLGDKSQCLIDANQAVRLKGDSCPNLRQRARLQIFLGSPSLALADLNAAKRLRPEDGSTHYYLGYAHRELKNYVEAIDAYALALKLTRVPAQLAECHHARGHTYFAMNKYEQAANDFSRALEIAPSAGYLYIDRADVCVEQGNHDAAILAYTIATRCDIPDFLARAYEGRAIAWAHKNEWSAALVDFDMAIELQPDSSSFHFAKAKWLARASGIEHRYRQEAVNAALAGCRLEKPLTTDALLTLADAFEANKQFGFAKNTLVRAKSMCSPAETAKLNDRIQKLEETITRKDYGKLSK